MTIHDGNPFADPEPAREMWRRFRGRLAAPVTIITSGQQGQMSGLTVSSLVLIEGMPPVVQAVIGPLTDLWSSIAETGRFVVHICDVGHQPLADVFAGLRPSPGGVFAATSHEEGEWGPVLTAIPDRMHCELASLTEVGHAGVVTGEAAGVEISELTEPLIHFRGKYRGLG